VTQIGQVIEGDGVYVRPVPHWVDAARRAATPAELRLWDALTEVEDPEYPVSVVDMGLIHAVRLAEGLASIDLTFTSMGCPCMEFIIADVRARLLREAGVRTVDLRIVWEPAWTRARLTPQAADKLRAWGVSL
jgi:metal-sulfur cluster biosynthetic enzyme